MSKNLQNIDKAFLQQLDAYKETPSENVWHNVENELNKKEAAFYKSKYLWLKRFLFCAVFLIAFILVSDVFKPVLKKSIDKQTENISRQQLNNASLKNNVAAPGKVPAHTRIDKYDYSKTKTGIDNLKSTYNVGTSSTSLTLKTNNNKQQSIINNQQVTANNQQAIVNNQPGVTNFVKENPVQVVLQSRMPVNDNKQEQPVFNANKKAVISINHQHAFYIIPYFSVDHVTGHIKKANQTVNTNLPPFDKERLDMSWTAGLLVEKQVSKKISLQSGLLHSFWENQITPAIVKALQDSSGDYKFKLATDYGYAELKKSGVAQNGDSAVVTNGVIKLQSFSVPVTAIINLKKGRFKINASAGAALNFITNDIAEIEYTFANNTEKDNVQKLEGLRKFYLTAVAGAEANYSFSKRISLGVSPAVRYAITPVNKNTLVKNYPVSFGAAAALHIKL